MSRRLDSAADRLCDRAEQVLNLAHDNVWEMRWDPVDEDDLLEAASWVKHQRRFRETGEHPFFLLRDELELQAALGDHLLRALSSTLSHWNRRGYGPELDPALVDETRAAMKEYWELRQEEGGPGSANQERWFRPD